MKLSIYNQNIIIRKTKYQKQKIMKTRKIAMAVLLLSITVLLNAQLKVNSNGSLSTGYTGYANLNMSSVGNVGSDGTVWGKWAFEIWGENLNIWKPWPSANNGESNYYLFLTPSGAIGVGQVPTHSGICLDVKGKVYSGGYELTSDERLKTDIKPLTDKLDKLYQLNGKSYKKHTEPDELNLPDIKDEKGNVIKKFEKRKNRISKETAEFGFLAQELKEVYPELVSQDTLGYYYVNYIGLIPVLVEALKDQKAQIAALTELVTKPNSGPKKVGAVTTSGLTETDALTYPVLDQNVPNPFNTSTTIGYYLPTTITDASIYVYDMNGVQLKSYSINQRGKGNITIQGSEFNAGMYLYALIADGKVIDTKRMILIK